MSSLLASKPNRLSHSKDREIKLLFVLREDYLHSLIFTEARADIVTTEEGYFFSLTEMNRYESWKFCYGLDIRQHFTIRSH